MSRRRFTIIRRTGQSTSLTLDAKRKQRDNTDDNDMNRWYDSVDENATPDEIFWNEMKRQQQQQQQQSSMMDQQSTSPSSSTSSYSSLYASAASAATSSTSFDSMNYNAAIGSSSSTQSQQQSQSQKQPTIMNAKAIEATLAEYDMYRVTDNWLNEDIVDMLNYEEQQQLDEENVPSLDEQLDAWAASSDTDSSSYYDDDLDDEPWDNWGKEEEEESDDDDEDSMKFKSTDDNDEEEEAAYVQRLLKLKIYSKRLEKAKRSGEKAKIYFNEQKPNINEGYDRLWISAIDNVCVNNLIGTFSNYGIQFLDNFGDWYDGCLDDSFATIEDIASLKARQVYNVTGLPCIAVRTSFEIEPVFDYTSLSSSNSGGSIKTTTTRQQQRTTAQQLSNNPRVLSGYRFNDIGMYVEYICDALRPISEPDRVTRFRTCLCFYDGDIEIFTYGTLDCDIYFANTLRTFIPVAQAINEMLKTLELTFGLEYEKWLRLRIQEQEDAIFGNEDERGVASMKLRDRVLKEGRVLPNDIVDVSAFMDSQVDVNLMDECANELANKFIKYKPNKILTVATTGLVLALPMAKYLQIPVVYARKERNVVMADTYSATYTSKTVGKNRELLVSTKHLHDDDRILIIDDFLSSGSSQEALLRIVSQSNAQAVGIGVLLEKVYDSGRQSLSGYDIPVHSLCRIASVESGVIQLLEEDGYNVMEIQNKQ